MKTQTIRNIQTLGHLLDRYTLFAPRLVKFTSTSVPFQRTQHQMMKGAIFDLDGTLVDSMGDIADAANYAMTALGYRTHSIEEYKKIAGGGNTKLITSALRIQMGSEPDTELVEQGVQLKIKYENIPNGNSHTKPFPGITEMLMELQNAGVQLAVLSNKTELHVRSVVKKCFPGIDWKYVAGARENTPLKPDPTAAIGIVNEYMEGIESADCVFVGDTEYDMVAGKSAGMTPLGVSWGFRKSNELIASGAVKVVDHVKEIVDFVIAAENV